MSMNPNGPDESEPDETPPTPAEALQMAYELFCKAPDKPESDATATLLTANVMLNFGNLAAAIERNFTEQHLAGSLMALTTAFTNPNSEHNRRERQRNRLLIKMSDSMAKFVDTYEAAVEDLGVLEDDTRTISEPPRGGVLDFLDEPVPPRNSGHDPNYVGEHAWTNAEGGGWVCPCGAAFGKLNEAPTSNADTCPGPDCPGCARVHKDMTNGDVAALLQRLKDVGIPKSSIEFIVNRMVWEGEEPTLPIIHPTNLTAIVTPWLNGVDVYHPAALVATIVAAYDEANTAAPQAQAIPSDAQLRSELINTLFGPKHITKFQSMANNEASELLDDIMAVFR